MIRVRVRATIRVRVKVKVGVRVRVRAGVEQAVGQGGRMPLQISMHGGENRFLPSHFSMASLPMVRLKFGEN